MENMRASRASGPVKIPVRTLIMDPDANATLRLERDMNLGFSSTMLESKPTWKKKN